jgi:hypothetical protein
VNRQAAADRAGDAGSVRPWGHGHHRDGGDPLPKRKIRQTGACRRNIRGNESRQTSRGTMSIKIRSDDLSPAEASFLKWQYGFDDEDEPFTRALWQAIGRAWDADAASEGKTQHLARLGDSGAYPEEVALYVKFRVEGGDKVWKDLIRRAGLSDRRTARVDTAVDRRRRA